MADVLLYEVLDGVVVITLNRPERRNAVNAELGQALNEALVRAATESGVRALVITGAGQGFCAGGDADHLARGAAGTRAPHIPATEPNPIFEALPGTPPELRSRYTFARAMPIPVIAAVNGPAAGAGLALALSADIRFASPSAVFMGGFVRIGAIPELGLAWSLTQTIGAGPAREMLLSGRRVNAEEALRLGLVSRICAEGEVLAESLAYAREMIAACSPRSIAVTKRLLNAVPTQTFAEAFGIARVEAAAAMASPHFREGVAAMKERRPPKFSEDY
jgi:enoyl-CoA hydratase/carnithine racemase